MIKLKLVPIFIILSMLCCCSTKNSESNDIYNNFTQSEIDIMDFSKKAKFALTVDIFDYDFYCSYENIGKQMAVTAKIINLSDTTYSVNFEGPMVLEFNPYYEFVYPSSSKGIPIDKTEFKPYEIIEVPVNIILDYDTIEIAEKSFSDSVGENLGSIPLICQVSFQAVRKGEEKKDNVISDKEYLNDYYSMNLEVEINYNKRGSLR